MQRSPFRDQAPPGDDPPRSPSSAAPPSAPFDLGRSPPPPVALVAGMGLIALLGLCGVAAAHHFARRLEPNAHVEAWFSEAIAPTDDRP